MTASADWFTLATYILPSVANCIPYTCDDTIVQTINIPASVPVLSITGQPNLCAGESITLTASGANTYSWTLPSGPGSTTSSLAASPGVTSIYTLSGTNTITGCSATKKFAVTVNHCTAIEKNKFAAVTHIYPNPARNELFIENEKTTQVIIYNELGSVIFDRRMEVGKK